MASTYKRNSKQRMGIPTAVVATAQPEEPKPVQQATGAPKPASDFSPDEQTRPGDVEESDLVRSQVDDFDRTYWKNTHTYAKINPFAPLKRNPETGDLEEVMMFLKPEQYSNLPEIELSDSTADSDDFGGPTEPDGPSGSYKRTDTTRGVPQQPLPLPETPEVLQNPPHQDGSYNHTGSEVPGSKLMTPAALDNDSVPPAPADTQKVAQDAIQESVAAVEAERESADPALTPTEAMDAVDPETIDDVIASEATDHDEGAEPIEVPDKPGLSTFELETGTTPSDKTEAPDELYAEPLDTYWKEPNSILPETTGELNLTSEVEKEGEIIYQKTFLKTAEGQFVSGKFNTEGLPIDEEEEPDTFADMNEKYIPPKPEPVNLAEMDQEDLNVHRKSSHKWWVVAGFLGFASLIGLGVYADKMITKHVYKDSAVAQGVDEAVEVAEATPRPMDIPPTRRPRATSATPNRTTDASTTITLDIIANSGMTPDMTPNTQPRPSMYQSMRAGMGRLAQRVSTAVSSMYQNAMRNTTPPTTPNRTTTPNTTTTPTTQPTAEQTRDYNRTVASLKKIGGAISGWYRSLFNRSRQTSVTPPTPNPQPIVDPNAGFVEQGHCEIQLQPDYDNTSYNRKALEAYADLRMSRAPRGSTVEFSLYTGASASHARGLENGKDYNKRKAKKRLWEAKNHLRRTLKKLSRQYGVTGTIVEARSYGQVTPIEITDAVRAEAEPQYTAQRKKGPGRLSKWISKIKQGVVAQIERGRMIYVSSRRLSSVSETDRNTLILNNPLDQPTGPGCRSTTPRGSDQTPTYNAPDTPEPVPTTPNSITPDTGTQASGGITIDTIVANSSFGTHNPASVEVNLPTYSESNTITATVGPSPQPKKEESIVIEEGTPITQTGETGEIYVKNKAPPNKKDVESVVLANDVKNYSRSGAITTSETSNPDIEDEPSVVSELTTGYGVKGEIRARTKPNPHHPIASMFVEKSYRESANKLDEVNAAFDELIEEQPLDSGSSYSVSGEIRARTKPNPHHPIASIIVNKEYRESAKRLNEVNAAFDELMGEQPEVEDPVVENIHGYRFITTNGSPQVESTYHTFRDDYSSLRGHVSHGTHNPNLLDKTSEDDNSYGLLANLGFDVEKPESNISGLYPGHDDDDRTSDVVADLLGKPKEAYEPRDSEPIQKAA
ncbi:hypothetical protein ACFL0V_00985 [Nanoarchaeota archaeon]